MYFVIFFFPADIFNIKKIMLAILIFFNIEEIILRCITKKFYFFYSIIYPVVLFIGSVFNTGNIVGSLKGIYVFFYLWMIIILKKYSINYKHLFMNLSFLMSLTICIIAFLDLIGFLHIYTNPIVIFMNQTQNAMISKSPNAIFTYVIFLKASPLIYFLLIEMLSEGKWFKAFIAFDALILSGTRANIYIAIVIVLIWIVYIQRIGLKKIILCTIMGLVAIICVPEFLYRVITINSAKSYGDMIRNDKIISSIYWITHNIKVFILGMGCETQYTSINYNIIYEASESSYIEFWRVFGILGLGMLLIFLGYTWLNIRRKEYSMVYVLYLAACWVEPFLFTSTGFAMLILMYSLKNDYGESAAWFVNKCIAKEKTHGNSN